MHMNRFNDLKKKTKQVFWLLHGLVFKLQKTVTNRFKIVFVQNFALCDYGTLKGSDVKLSMTNRQSIGSTEFMLYWRYWIYSTGFKNTTSNNNVRKKKITDIMTTDYKWYSQSWESEVSLCRFYLNLVMFTALLNCPAMVPYLLLQQQ